MRFKSRAVSIGEGGAGDQGLPGTGEGEVGLRRPAAKRASGIGAGVRREILVRVTELEEGIAGEDSNGATAAAG